MNLAEKMLAKTKEVDDRDIMTEIFDEFILPSIERAASNKQRHISFDTFGGPSSTDRRIQELCGTHSLKNLIETKMKPYLEEQGFRVITTSPSYWVYIRW